MLFTYTKDMGTHLSLPALKSQAELNYRKSEIPCNYLIIFHKKGNYLQKLSQIILENDQCSFLSIFHFSCIKYVNRHGQNTISIYATLE